MGWAMIPLALIAVGVIVLAGMATLNISIKPSAINSCASDSDCMLVSSSAICGGATAINAKHVGTWNTRLKYERILSFGGKVACKPTLPLDYFEAKCAADKCIPVQQP